MMNRPNRKLAVIIFVLFSCSVGAATKDDDFSREKSWNLPVANQIANEVLRWAQERSIDEATKSQLQQLWSDDGMDRNLLHRTVASFAMVDENAKSLFDFCQQHRSTQQLPETRFLNDEAMSDFYRDNLSLYYGQWLAAHQLYNEVDQQLHELQPEDVVDPGMLLFFQAVAHHRLLNKEDCLLKLEQLLEHRDSIPRRYSTLAQLMEADLKPLKEDSLDEISRLMDNIKVRLGHGRAGSRVRKEEDDVIAKLDKMIEELEEQAQQQAQQQSGQGGNGQGKPQSSNPAEDSYQASGSGPGNVDPKKLGENAEWGDLPQKEREAALQRLSRDLPSHYRDVIEDYFQKLATDER